MKPHQINLIGVKARVIDSSNESLIGLEGVVVDETKNTLSIESDKVRKVLKKEVKLQINTPDGGFVVDGVDLVGRPEERLRKKSKVKKRW